MFFKGNYIYIYIKTIRFVWVLFVLLLFSKGNSFGFSWIPTLAIDFFFFNCSLFSILFCAQLLPTAPYLLCCKNQFVCYVFLSTFFSVPMFSDYIPVEMSKSRTRAVLWMASRRFHSLETIIWSNQINFWTWYKVVWLRPELLELNGWGRFRAHLTDSCFDGKYLNQIYRTFSFTLGISCIESNI